MGLSHSISAYGVPLPASTDNVDVVGRGVRGRLMSVWYMPDDFSGVPGSTPDTLSLKTGGASGSVIFECDIVLIDYLDTGIRENSPFSFGLNGILFTDGINAVASSPAGMQSISVTYIGEG